ncbi:MAG: response regulator [Candidatus Aureabacteria bacterium]|nr:response regulator [Candidatus Auribacterota bacterium]
MQAQSLKVLLVEDSHLHAQVAQKLLNDIQDENFQIEWASSLSQGLEYLKKAYFDVILLDLTLPDSRGLDTFARLCASVPEIPIIVLSGLDDKKIAIDAVKQGAQDYIVKGEMYGELLVRAIHYAIERKKMEGELKRTLEELKRSNEELEQFAYVASHDLQEPLRMVGSYVQLLEKRYKGKLDSNADDFIAFAVDGVSRMQGLISDLLKYSRVGTRGKDFRLVDVQSLLKQAMDNLQVALKECGAEVTYENLPEVMADDVQLIQLLQNLIGNAVKFKSGKPPRIHVYAEKKRSEWVFCVEDNGIGIDLKHGERIFKIFQRLHTREEYQGTGIGLAVCKRIVERHGGRIWVESQKGEGSSFFFTLPSEGTSSPTQ